MDNKEGDTTTTLTAKEELRVVPEAESASGELEISDGMDEKQQNGVEEGERAGDYAVLEEPLENDSFTKWRNRIGFWIIGLCNNFPYVIMLSAAFDIIHLLDNPDNGNHGSNGTNVTNKTDQCVRDVNGTWPGRERCVVEGTSLILLADILPTFILKIFAPYFMNFVPYWIRVFLAASFSLTSFILVGLSLNKPLVIFGVVCASIASGFGELTFLALTARYDKSTVTAWSSGTGAAGVGGALAYLLLRIFLSPAVTLYIQTVIPFLMIVSFVLILGKPGKILPPTKDTPPSSHLSDEPPNMNGTPFEEEPLIQNEPSSIVKKNGIKFFNKEELGYWLEHMKYIPRLWKYMLPLFVVYIAEYMINQSLFEQLYNSGTHVLKWCINQGTQYRVLQVMYQFGVLVSRSSVVCFHFKYYWILSVLQVVNFVFFFFAACYLFIPSFWITFILIFYEGLLGGGVYVNAFYAIAKDVPKVHREFSMGVASVADSSGIFVAAVISEWGIHKYICDTFVHYVDDYYY